MAKKFKTKIKRVPIEVSKKDILIRQVEKSVSKTNQRLKSLKKGGLTGTWSSKKLINRLSGGKIKAYSGGKVRIKKNANITELNAILKATSQFLLSGTSTKKGISKIAEKTKESMYQTLKIDSGTNITKEDIEVYYEMLGNKDFDFFNEQIGASAMWAIIDDSIEMGDNRDTFIRKLGMYTDVSDSEIKEKAIRLFDKYIL